MIVEDISLDSPKTSQFTEVLKSLNVDRKKILFITPEYNENLYLSMRNLPYVGASLLADINTYDIVNVNVLVLTESAAKVFSEDAVEA